MTATPAGIETTYRGARFRSRLEARWAAMFDALGWRWEYEPVDLDGYIPDFVLVLRQPLLAEVKSEFTCEALIAAASGKIEASGWLGVAQIVGASWDVVERHPSSTFGPTPCMGPFADLLRLGCCGPGGEVVAVKWLDSLWLDFCGDNYDDLATLWNEAGTAVRWRAPSMAA